MTEDHLLSRIVVELRVDSHVANNVYVVATLYSADGKASYTFSKYLPVGLFDSQFETVWRYMGNTLAEDYQKSSPKHSDKSTFPQPD